MQWLDPTVIDALRIGLLGRLLLATALGGLIGLERELGAGESRQAVAEPPGAAQGRRRQRQAGAVPGSWRQFWNGSHQPT